MTVDDIAGLRRILMRCRSIAVVGISANWYRPSYFAAKYMQDHGYQIFPVDPNYQEVLGQPCFPTIASIPEPVDIVDCFRKSEEIVPLAHEAIAKHAKVLWMQLGIRNDEAATIVFDSADHAASLFNLQTFGNVYSRISNPTVAALEERVAALEGGRAALAAATGMAAQMIALLTLCRAGDHLIASHTLYGGTYSQFAVTFAQFGIEATFVEADDPENFRRALKPNTKALYAETIGNPQLNVADIEAIGAVARRAGIPLVIDNTLASPYLCRPFEHGADIVVHSLTKYLGGHGTTMGGIVVESGKFPWDNGNFPQMTEASRGYHGVRFYETFGDFGFTMKARMETMRTLGPTLSPLSAFLLLQGIETLHVRMPRHCESALAVARHLASHPAVEWVNYPLLAGNRYETLARKYLPRGAGGILTFGVKGGAKAGDEL